MDYTEDMTTKQLPIIRKIWLKLPVLLYDALSIPLAFAAAFWLRYNLHPFSHALTSTHASLALTMLFMVQTSCYYYFGIYRGLWRYASLNDVTKILKASVSATTFAIPAFYLSSILQHMPRSVFPLYCIILIALLCGGRLLVRLYWDKKSISTQDAMMNRVLIIGAGRAGEGLVRDLKRDKNYYPVAFVDDSLGKQKLEVHGVRVLGTIQDIVAIVKRYDINLIFIAIPTASSADMRRIVSYCEQSKITFRTLPSLPALVAGRVEVNALRPVHIDDLLGRDQVCLEWDKIAASLLGKRVLVTGGGGSIGAELCRQIMTLNPACLVIVDNSEFNLYQIEQELVAQGSKINLELILASVTDSVAIEQLFSCFKPDIVFHAAAYKHVPLLQHQIRAAVTNNVLGTQIVAKASVAANVSKFILISTDKAVNPTNIMGTTKRVAEIYCQNLNMRVSTQFITVRFGNVLGSAGSVVPLFQKQLLTGGPITVTHPEMERYFMTIPEACGLILQAMICGEGGEIFVLDMGEPIKITYLAEQMIRLAGKIPGKDIKITYTGLRPGEKLFEELFHSCEQLVATEHKKLFQAQFRAIEWDALNQALRMLHQACNEYQINELLVLLKSLVPEFQLKGELA
jgi:FlaA1/EpsC-like NDP-sugar epimerase